MWNSPSPWRKEKTSEQIGDNGTTETIEMLVATAFANGRTEIRKRVSWQRINQGAVNANGAPGHVVAKGSQIGNRRLR